MLGRYTLAICYIFGRDRARLFPQGRPSEKLSHLLEHSRIRNAGAPARSGLADGIVNSQCIDTTKWVRATDDSVRESMEMLRDRKPGMRKDDFLDLEKAKTQFNWLSLSRLTSRDNIVGRNVVLLVARRMHGAVIHYATI